MAREAMGLILTRGLNMKKSTKNLNSGQKLMWKWICWSSCEIVGRTQPFGENSDFMRNILKFKGQSHNDLLLWYEMDYPLWICSSETYM